MPGIPQILIRDDIKSTLETITVSNGYNTNIEHVFAGRIISIDKFSTTQRKALIQLRLVSEDDVTISGRTKTSSIKLAQLSIILQLSMTNTTEEAMWGFINDVKGVLAQCPNRNLVNSNVYEGIDTLIQGTEIQNSDERDELGDSTQLDMHQQVAEMTILVEYSYIPEWISGTIN